MKIDPLLILPDKSKSINQGGIKASGWAMEGSTIAAMYFEALSKAYKFSLDTPVGELPDEVIDVLLYGTKGRKIKVVRKTSMAAAFTRPNSRASSITWNAVSAKRRATG